MRLVPPVATPITGKDLRALLRELVRAKDSVEFFEREFAGFVAAEVKKWGKVVKDSGMKVE